MFNLAVILERSARQYPDRVAVVSGTTRMTYAEVDAQARRFAGTLTARGLRPGDRVALSCPNGVWFPIAHFGIQLAGLTTVPLNILLTRREVAQHLDASGARAYVCHSDVVERALGETGAAELARAEGDEYLVRLPASPSDLTAAGGCAPFQTVGRSDVDTAVVLYTSGTTGRPKGAELTHSNLVQNALLANQMYEVTANDVHLVSVPLFHTFGLTILLHAGFAAGATLVMTERFDPAGALEVMRREEVTVFAGVPTAYWSLLRAAGSPGHERDTAAVADRLRIGISGGAPLPVKILAAFEERFSTPVIEGYGLSETSPIAVSNRMDLPRRPGFVGRPVRGVEVRLAREDGTPAPVGQPGEILIRGHNVMKGYLDDPEATREAIDGEGWFHSGDIGRLDADGYLAIVDRRKDMIIRNGFNVYPRELEEVLHTHPQVSLAAVIGIPHEQHGEEVKAFVVRTPDATVTERDLLDWCSHTMAAYKYPRLIEFRESLPLSATGKVLKRELPAS